ncbi:hypothetical protein DTO166G4_8410 [Paecilomyces variotii]|uniref:Uncharacterized protein n=1 Tax=Byssochlamys spectabilis TaxID=264951 RepID=A0A443HPT1_BYSSP|nr:hypothetical protein C8Q69DRAFT_475000 [Paecilomyces variotii]KAJ9204015.1 hypothetical protein DTO032I3_2821 [Paecilomyces variotii]KAJ9209998.1 hypothetical protein DTO166G4_8410 [Paecilomyces variotii]KAJ9226835.1 hypothetical protein DTO169C6_590 [Paecilomyces variotii]KAJ9238055.1 hypothetical protein DTO169E5_4897 [Paecilomyces variotii]KAJ9250250.1 hypothetical protein DTO207G8_6175 [Paecilomyces variotii]
MPRPPAKRNRLPPSVAPTKGRVTTRKNASQKNTIEDGDVTSIRNQRGATRHERPTSGGHKEEREISNGRKGDTSGSLEETAAPSEDVSETHTSRPPVQQTPIAKSHGRTLGSSPATERPQTGNRPASRPRGYSSTLSLAGRKGDIGSKVPGTPAFESSMLSNFRRRPRQPSILQMMQADGSSDLDDDDFLGDLSPQDESTPLALAKRELPLPQPSPSPSALSLNLSSGKRKRSLIEDEEPELPSARSSVAPSIVSSDSENERDASDRPLPAFSAQLERFSQTMAPPMSSSPAQTQQETDTASSVHPRLSKERVRKGDDAGSGQRQMSTAALQENFLPRRRRPRRRVKKGADIDILSDNSEEESDPDDDELNRLPSKKTAKSRRKLLAESENATNSGTKQKTTNQRGRKRQTATNASRTKSSTRASSTSKTQQRDSLTYSRRRRDVEKENDDADVSTTSSRRGSVSDLDQGTPKPAGSSRNRELEEQAKKFAEIDKWEMDFEDVIESSSQQT